MKKKIVVKLQTGGLSKGQTSHEALFQIQNNSNHYAGHITHNLAQGQLLVCDS